MLVLGVKGKDMLIEHSIEDQLYEINGPKKKIFLPSSLSFYPKDSEKCVNLAN